MTNCKVLRCTGKAAGVLVPIPEYEVFQIPLCAEHDSAVNGGDPWILDGNMCVPTLGGSPDAGYHVRMGADLPIIVTSFHLSGSIGHKPGVRMRFQSDIPGHPSSTEFWISEDMGSDLADFFKPKE